MPFVSRARLGEYQRAARELEAHHADSISCDEAQTAAAKAAAESRVQVRGLAAQVRQAEDELAAERLRVKRVSHEFHDLQRLFDAAIKQAEDAEQRARLAAEHVERLERQLAEATAPRGPVMSRPEPSGADARVAQLTAALEHLEAEMHARDRENQRLLRERDAARSEAAGLAKARDTALGLLGKAPDWPERINNESTRGAES